MLESSAERELSLSRNTKTEAMERLENVTRKPVEGKGSSVTASSKVVAKTHKCGLCDAAFARSFDLKMHIRTHTGEKPHKCAVCGASFIASGQLKKHIRRHTGEKPYKCTVCNSSFTLAHHLKAHVVTHTGEKPYKCTVCEASFVRSCKLKIHMRIHTGEKPYKCTFCDGAFSYSSSFKDHIRTHTGEKPYKCTMCDASFMNSRYLKKHVTTHGDVKVYECSFCEASYTQAYLLKRHIMTHTGEKPHKCSLCEASFAESYELMRHMKIHTGEKPHKCAICDASFSRCGAMKNHMRIHTGEKPYKCNLCGATFYFSRGMSKHMRRHRGEFSKTSRLIIHKRTSGEEVDKNDYFSESCREGSLDGITESSSRFEGELVGPSIDQVMLKEEPDINMYKPTEMFQGKLVPDENDCCDSESCKRGILDHIAENFSPHESELGGSSFVQVLLKEEPETGVYNQTLTEKNMLQVKVEHDQNDCCDSESCGEDILDAIIESSSSHEDEIVVPPFVRVMLKEEPEMNM